MKLSEQQQAFTRMIPALFTKAIELGFEITLGDAYRDKRCSYGSKTSKHHTRQAIDLNLFKNGVYLRKTEDHKELGEWWKARGGVWGGDFKQKDGNHYQASESGEYTPEISKSDARIYSVTVKSLMPIIITEDAQ